MKLFKRMNEVELVSWRKGALLGFYVYITITAINYIYYVITKNELFSPTFIFFSGLFTAFIFEFIFNFKYKNQASVKAK